MAGAGYVVWVGHLDLGSDHNFLKAEMDHGWGEM